MTLKPLPSLATLPHLFDHLPNLSLASRTRARAKEAHDNRTCHQAGRQQWRLTQQSEAGSPEHELESDSSASRLVNDSSSGWVEPAEFGGEASVTGDLSPGVRVGGGLLAGVARDPPRGRSAEHLRGL